MGLFGGCRKVPPTSTSAEALLDVGHEGLEDEPERAKDFAEHEVAQSSDTSASRGNRLDRNVRTDDCCCGTDHGAKNELFLH